MIEAVVNRRVVVPATSQSLCRPEVKQPPGLVAGGLGVALMLLLAVLAGVVGWQVMDATVMAAIKRGCTVAYCLMEWRRSIVPAL